MTFTKLERGILMSSILAEPGDVFKTFMILLAACDADSIARISPVFIANAGKMPLEVVHEALAKHEAPDPDSRSQAEEGRRIRRVDGGYFIINYEHYRTGNPNSPEAIRARKFRNRKKEGALRNVTSRDVTLPPSSSSSSSSEDLNTTEDKTEGKGVTARDNSVTSRDIEERKIKVFDRWNEFARKRGLAEVLDIPAGSARERSLLARLKEPAWNLEKILEAIDHQPFLLGDNPQGFMVDFEFILKPSRYLKIIEGSYRDGIRGRAKERQPDDPYVGASRKR